LVVATTKWANFVFRFCIGHSISGTHCFDELDTPFTMTMAPSQRCFLAYLLVCCLLHASLAFSIADRSQLARSRLHEALSSPSGKLTLSPELVIPDPTDPTAILLQSSIIQSMSTSLRNSKTNAAYIQGSVTAVQTFLAEQETARGNFPGPLPVVYCMNDDDDDDDNNDCSEKDLKQLSDAGAAGLLVTMRTETMDFHNDCAQALEVCKRALECGLQPIPQVIVSEETIKSWTEDDTASLVEKLISSLDMEPVSILLTVDASSSPEKGEDEEEDEPVALPPVSKQLSKRIPILGSVSVSAGENRIGAEIARLKDAGFTGSVIRAECVPSSQRVDLERVGRFWQACISDLKSTRSKNFALRVKNKMEKHEATEWLNFSKSVMDSGALGEVGGDASEIGVDADSGDYKGF
jgi:hypothetical protein